MLGADAFANSVVTIDYQHRSVTFGEHPGPEDTAGVPLAFVEFVPVVPVQLGTTRALLAVDTGDESTINLSYDYYRAHPDLFIATDERSVSGVGGSSEELLGEIAQVQVGDFRVEALKIGTTRTLRSTAEGHLGAGFLSHFRVVLEYARGRLGLTARAGDSAVLSPAPSHR